jgi:hypothetical protein
VRISGLKAGLAAALLATAAMTAACSTTVDGAATCPGCGTATEPEFPTTRPSGPETSQPPSTPSAPSSTPSQKPSGGGQTLPPNDNGYVYIETKSGKTRCQISADTVGCESDFSNSPVVDGQPANGVEVSSSGTNRWILGNLGAMPTTTIDYGTYSAVGWTIVADSTGTTFTNDGTGHGMFVSTERVDFF